MHLTDTISLAGITVVLASLAYAGAGIPARQGELFYSHDLPQTPMNAQAPETPAPSLVQRDEPADEF